MSATNRGSERTESDNYPTPAWCVQRLLKRLQLPDGAWLEPAAGDGAIIRATNSCRPAPAWSAIELRPECKSHLLHLVEDGCYTARSFLEPFNASGWDVIITNPPYSLAEEFIRVALTKAQWVVMLLRLNFLGSAKRRALFANEMPDIYVLPNRPSFTGQGTDATEYCWMAWTPERGRTQGRIEILAETPASERSTRTAEPALYRAPDALPGQLPIPAVAK